MKQIVNTFMCAEKLKIFVSCIAILTLSGCGLKGPLYETPTKPENKQNTEVQSQVKQEK